VIPAARSADGSCGRQGSLLPGAAGPGRSEEVADSSGISCGGPGPRPAFVVLGASNVVRGLAHCTAVARTRTAGPFDLFVAAGHGRGYRVATRIWQRRLPSILACGLWRALDRVRPDAPLAVITDVGNELLYGLGVSAVADAVREAASRLADRGARLAITGLPLAAIGRVGPLRYRLLRSLYVPGCLLELAKLEEAARWLDEELRAIAAATAAEFVEQPAAWYGLDTLHVRRSRLPGFWQRIGDAWMLPAAAAAQASLADWLLLGSSAAEVRSIGRRRRLTPQPAVDRVAWRAWLY